MRVGAKSHILKSAFIVLLRGEAKGLLDAILSHLAFNFQRCDMIKKIKLPYSREVRNPAVMNSMNSNSGVTHTSRTRELSVHQDLTSGDYKRIMR